MKDKTTHLYVDSHERTLILHKSLSELLHSAVQRINGEITELDNEIDQISDEQDTSIPADPNVRNFSFALVDGKVYFRENDRMTPATVSMTAENRIKGLIEIRDCVRRLIEYQTEDYPEEKIHTEQENLNRLYDSYTEKYGLINSRGNYLAFASDESYFLLCSLEVLDDEGNFKRKADMFTKRTNEEQRQQLSELLAEENNSLWSAVLYGISVGDGEIVTVALSQVGNVGGQPYWSWYGFDGRVEWCACYVSWCANECGYIDSGVIPKFAGCANGVQWFKDRGQWQDSSFEPSAGQIIFFDWECDGEVDHVGIVEKCENGIVYTVEGNSGDACRQKQYAVGSSVIYGYGIPAY